MPDPELLCVYQFKVVLRGISPMIWRRLLLRSDQSIADLHYTIQIAMGWSDSHLHRFHIHGKDYGVAHEGGLTFSDDPKRVLLAQFGFRLRERFLYEYDFYDNWKHDIRLEKVLPLNSKRVFPVCVGGQRPVPPEDSGGARAYREEGDPRWQIWWDAVPREDLKLIAKTVKRFLDSKGDRSIIEDRENLTAAVDRSKLIVIVGRTELTGAPLINGLNNMLVARGNGSFVRASGDEILHPSRRGIRSWSTRAGDRLFGAQRAPTGGGRSAASRGIPGNSACLPALWESPKAES